MTLVDYIAAVTAAGETCRSGLWAAGAAAAMRGVWWLWAATEPRIARRQGDRREHRRTRERPTKQDPYLVGEPHGPAFLDRLPQAQVEAGCARLLADLRAVGDTPGHDDLPDVDDLPDDDELHHMLPGMPAWDDIAREEGQR